MMAYQFANTENHNYKAGDFFLGLDPKRGGAVGIRTERHGITIAGAGSGKGAALIIPNLHRWPHNALVVDPKGENAEKTWQARESMGQRVRVLDPFGVAKVPPHVRISCNLLAGIQPDSPTAREDIRVIADGMVMRYKAEDGTWDNGAVSVLSGMIAYVCADPNPEGRNLPALRQLLTLPPETLHSVFEEMSGMDVFGGLCKAAAAIGLSDSRKNKEFVGGAVDHSEWLDSPAIGSVLTGDGFALSELKTQKTTVYLVLPPQYLGEHGRFLRLFARAALDAMAKDLGGQKCLFLLDEFFALGRIDEIAKAAGLMRGYGVQLWPFLQDLGQLTTLYGRDGAHTFFGNSDVHIFFGNTDAPTLDYVSARLGTWRSDELGSPPTQMNPATSIHQPTKDNFLNSVPSVDQGVVTANQNAMNRYAHGQRLAGAPRMPAEQVRETVAKKDGDKVARNMIVFAKGNAVFLLKPAPYFESGPELNGERPIERLPVPSDRPDINPKWMPPVTASIFDHEPPPAVRGWSLMYVDDSDGCWVYQSERGARVLVWSYYALHKRRRILLRICREEIWQTKFGLWPSRIVQAWQNTASWESVYKRRELIGYGDVDPVKYSRWKDEIEGIENTLRMMQLERLFWAWGSHGSYDLFITEVFDLNDPADKEANRQWLLRFIKDGYQQKMAEIVID